MLAQRSEWKTAIRTRGKNKMQVQTIKKQNVKDK